ncbi:MAG: TIM barrel protein [Cyclobacteriaceae bacterium]
MRTLPINRRKFIKHSALASATIMTAQFGCSQSRIPKYKIGIQLFSIRDALEAETIRTLQKVAELGYQDLETYGFDPQNLKYYGFDASEFKMILDDLGLTVSSGHYPLFEFLDKPFDELESYVDRCILGAKALGKSYITWPWLPEEARNLETFKKLPEILNRIGEQVTSAGLGFAYHNHDFEFTDYDGVCGYDIILQETDPDFVKLQLDMYWAAHSSKLSSSELIALQPGRFVMWHIKDMDKKTRDYSELGNGSIDYHDVLQNASQEGLKYYYLEQGGNYADNSMQSIATSISYFKNELQQYL